MRISEEMAKSLVALAKEHIADNAKVWLFGSRVRDDAKGGDIDIMIEASSIENPPQKKIRFWTTTENSSSPTVDNKTNGVIFSDSRKGQHGGSDEQSG